MAGTVASCSGRAILNSIHAVKQGRFVADAVPVVIFGVQRQQLATLKATHGEKYPYPEPYPYWKKKYNIVGRFFDKTTRRFNENTKVIVVEGNVAVGKKDFAKRLAKEFDMKYFGPTTEEDAFTMNDYNYDVRQLNYLLPESVKMYDLTRFLNEKHPEKGSVARFMIPWFHAKYLNYYKVMRHVLNTGQGAVMVRSVYSDVVFLEAMRRMGYITPQFLTYYKDLRDNSVCELVKPHLHIYLDAPLSVIRQRINERNNPDEVKSTVLNDKYLEAISDIYRNSFLPKMRRSGEVVEIDWAEVGTDMDMDVIAEELQAINLEPESSDSTQFEDWRVKTEDDWTVFRHLCDNLTHQCNKLITPLPYDAPESMYTQEQAELYEKVVRQHPAVKFQGGWAPELGNKTFFKF